ncbi:MAG: hydrogenase formation protein HypD [Planctomycetes bacterium]|nr:hydrogenase formation protein HypD [Planctomycetota bacterium]
MAPVASGAVSPAFAAELAGVHDLAARIGRQIQLMEVCGTHTVSIFRSGLRSLLPPNVRLVSGPGCPVCVTAQRHIDAAIRLGTIPDTLIATYGDMVRVPGAMGSLQEQRGRGADVRVVTSARAALHLAGLFPDRHVVFLGVGFETTAPATAAVVLEARRLGIGNFTVLAAHKLVVPAMLALLAGGRVRLDGFLCPGHVSIITGADAYRPVVERFRMPCVVAGFEPLGILRALSALLRQVQAGAARLENEYSVAVSASGNQVARRLIEEVFETAAAPWRALGEIPESGLRFRPAFRSFDALERFGIVLGEDEDHAGCRCGEVICGTVLPTECRLFGSVCTPLRPLGPCMVSSEGTCSAWYKYGTPPAARAPALEAV